MAKKLLAAALIIAVFAVALPLSLLTASADNALPTPETIGGTDYTDSISFAATDIERYAGLINGTTTGNELSGVGAGAYVPSGFAADTTLTEGVGVVSYKFTFHGDVLYTTTGETRTPTWGRVGVKLGTYTKNGGTRPIFVNFRRNQSNIYLMDSWGEAAAGFGSTAETQNDCTSLRITVKYDKAANEVSVWANDTFLKTLDMSTISDFTVTNDFGSVDLSGVGTTDGVANTVDVTEAKAFGSFFKSYGTEFVPTRGSKTDLTSQLTLSDETLNAAWKSTGKLTIPSGTAAQYYFNGITLNEGDTIYTSFALTQYGGSGSNAADYGLVWANGSTLGYFAAKPGWQQVNATTNAYSFVAGDAPLGNASKNSNVGPVIIYTKYVVDTGALEVWANYIKYGQTTLGLYKVGSYTVPNDQYRFGAFTNETPPQDTIIEYVQYWKDTTDRTYYQDALDAYYNNGQNFDKGSLISDTTYNLTGTGNVQFTGVDIDLSGDKSYTMEADVTVGETTTTEVRAMFVPIITKNSEGNKQIVAAGVAWNGNWSSGTGQPVQNGNPWFCTGVYNGLNNNSSSTVATGTTFKLRVVTTVSDIKIYINGELKVTRDISSESYVEPVLGIYVRRVSSAKFENLKIWGDALSTAKKNLTYKVVEGGNALYTTPATRYEVDNFGKLTANKSFSAIASNVDFSSTSNLTLKATVAIDSFAHDGDGGTHSNTVFVPRFIVGQYNRSDGKIGYLEYFVHRNWLHAALATEEHSVVAVQTDIKSNVGDQPYGYSFGSWTTEPTLSSVYSFEATIANGKLSIKLNGVSAIADYDLSQLDGFTPVLGAGALLDGDFGLSWNEETMVKLNDKATVTVITSFSTDDAYKTVTPYTDENGNKAFASGYNGEFVNITVAPANGFALKAGSLKLGDKNVINAVTTDTTGLTYDIESADAAIAAEFVTGNDAMTGAVLGTQYREMTENKPAAVRFLTRFYVNGLSDQNVQTENGIAVGTRTIKDYGVLAKRSEDLNGAELTMANKSYSASGINNYIYSYTENYVEIAVAITPNTDDTEYTLRGYIEFSDGTIVYTDAFTGTFAAAKAAAGK